MHWALNRAIHTFFFNPKSSKDTPGTIQPDNHQVLSAKGEDTLRSGF